MRMLPLAATAALTLALVGCGPSFNGSWKAQDLNGKAVADGGNAILNVNNDGTYFANVTDASGNTVSGSQGTWDKDGSDSIRMFRRTGEGPERMAGTVSGDTMTVIGDGFNGTFKKSK